MSEPLETKEERQKRLHRERQKRYLEKKKLKSEREQFRTDILDLKNKNEARKLPRISDAYECLEPLLRKAFGKTEEQKQAENKAIEQQVNESLEAQILRNICPKCKSSVCHCEEE